MNEWLGVIRDVVHSPLAFHGGRIRVSILPLSGTVPAKQPFGRTIFNVGLLDS